MNLPSTHAYINENAKCECQMRLAPGEWRNANGEIDFCPLIDSACPSEQSGQKAVRPGPGHHGKQLAVDRMQSQNLSAVHYIFNMHRNRPNTMHIIWPGQVDATLFHSIRFDSVRFGGKIIAHLIIIESWNCFGRHAGKYWPI